MQRSSVSRVRTQHGITPGGELMGGGRDVAVAAVYGRHRRERFTKRVRPAGSRGEDFDAAQLRDCSARLPHHRSTVNDECLAGLSAWRRRFLDAVSGGAIARLTQVMRSADARRVRAQRRTRIEASVGLSSCTIHLVADFESLHLRSTCATIPAPSFRD